MKVGLMAEPSGIGNDEPSNHIGRHMVSRHPDAAKKQEKNDDFSPIGCPFRPIQAVA
jgi:hypothetical protein